MRRELDTAVMVLRPRSTLVVAHADGASCGLIHTVWPPRPSVSTVKWVVVVLGVGWHSLVVDRQVAHRDPALTRPTGT